MNYFRHNGIIHKMCGGGVDYPSGKIFYAAMIDGVRVKIPRDECELLLPDKYIEMLKAENERLRSALKTIADRGNWEVVDPADFFVDINIWTGERNAAEIAGEALRGGL